MKRNPDLQSALKGYESVIATHYPQLQNQPDRTFFLSFLTAGMLRPPLGSTIPHERDGHLVYTAFKRNEINVSDPFDIAAGEKAHAVTADIGGKRKRADAERTAVRAGESVLNSARTGGSTPARIQQLENALKMARKQQEEADDALRKTEADSRKARDDAERFTDAQRKWDMGGRADIASIRRQVEYFLDYKSALDLALEKGSIRVPQKEAPDLPWSREILSREEYFRILGLLLMGKITKKQLEERAIADGLPGVRVLVTEQTSGLRISDPKAVTLRRAGSVYGDLLSEEIGPREALSSIGIQMGQNVRIAYWALRTNRVVPGMERLVGLQQVSKDVAEGKTSPLLQKGEDASSWLTDPMRAYHFLLQAGFQSTQNGGRPGPNEQFLAALRYYFEQPDTPRTPARAPGGLTKEATRSALQLIVQDLMEAERVLNASAEQRLSLATKEGSVESAIRGVKNILRDYKKNPLPAAVLAIVGVKMFLWTWRFLTGEHSKWVNYFGYASLGGLAVGLIQKSVSGSAWWDGAWTKLQEWRGNERKLDPKEQSLSNYWALECNMKDSQRRNCLLLLEEQDAATVLDWYGRMDQAVLRGDQTIGIGETALPFRIDWNAKEKAFGKMKDKEITLLFYQTLKEFFRNRGRAFQRNGGPMGDPASIGYTEIRRAYFQKYNLRTDAGPVFDTGRTVTDTKPKTERITFASGAVKEKILRPASHSVTHHAYRMEGMAAREEEQTMSRCPMWVIFWEQADAATLRLMGRDGATPAGILEQMQTGAAELAQYGRILLGDATRYTDRTVREIANKVVTATKVFPGTVVRISGKAGIYTYEVLTAAGISLGTFAYESYQDVEKQIYLLHGVPEDKYEKFQANLQYIARLSYDGKNAGLHASILGTSELVIGQFTPPDYLPVVGSDKPTITVSIAEFAGAEVGRVNQWVEEWKRAAVREKQKELSAFGAGTSGGLHIRSSGNPLDLFFEISNEATFVTDEHIARLSASSLSVSASAIDAAYTPWWGQPPAAKRANRNLPL